METVAFSALGKIFTCIKKNTNASTFLLEVLYDNEIFEMSVAAFVFSCDHKKQFALSIRYLYA